MATVTDGKVQNFIGGEFVDAERTEDVINPSTGEVIAQAPVSSAEDVDRAVEAARRAFESWGSSTPRSRSEVLLELAAVLDRPIDDVERIQHELSELELDLAMLESDVESAIDPEVAQRRESVALGVSQLQSALTDAFRELFDAVNADRNRGVPDAHALFGELDELVEQYRGVGV